MTSRRAVFHPEAAEDVKSIVAYYAERDAALPRRFRNRLQAQVERIEMFPESGAVLFEHYRRVLLRRFPYMAVYAVDNDRIDILAILSVRRDRAWIEAVVTARSEE